MLSLPLTSLWSEELPNAISTLGINSNSFICITGSGIGNKSHLAMKLLISQLTSKETMSVIHKQLMQVKYFELKLKVGTLLTL